MLRSNSEPLRLRNAFRAAARGRLSLLILLAIVFPSASAEAYTLFPGTFEPIDSPLPTSWSKLCDLDGDGEADVMGLCGDESSPCVFTRLGLGGGAFGPALTYASAAGIRFSPQIADVNGDGRSDLVFVRYSSAKVEVWLSNGDGTLQGPWVTPTDEGPVLVRVGEVNHDGHADLIVAHGSPTYALGTFMGHGDGTFDPPVLTHVSGTLKALAIGYLNMDDQLDVVVPYGVMVGHGDGTFTLDTQFSTTPYSTTTIEVADLDSNGRADIILAGTSQTSRDMTTVLLSRAIGGYTRTDWFMGSGPTDLLVTDLDGDGCLDLATANSENHQVGIRFGNGMGGFSGLPAFAGPVNSLSAADVDHDGRVDLWCERGLLRQTAHRVFGYHNAFYCGGAPVAMALGDMDGSGVPDVVVANRDAGTITVLLGQPDLRLGPGVAVPMGGRLYDVALGDFYRNGHPDVIAADHDGKTLKLRRGNGDGGFGAVVSLPVGAPPSALAVGDIDGDGLLDVVAVSNALPYGNMIFTLLGHGNGTFDPAVGMQAGFGTDIALARLDDDDLPDLVTASYNGVGVALNQGHGTFGKPTFMGPWVRYVAVGDLDGDGHLDIVAAGGANGMPGKLYVFHARGGGTFDPPTEWPMGGSRPATACALGDLDRDGKLDLVAVLGNVNLDGGSPDLQAIRLGNGDCTFGAAQISGTEFCPSDVALADFDGDGLPELVVSNFMGANVSVVANQSALLAVPPAAVRPAPAGFEVHPNPAGPEVRFQLALAAEGHATLTVRDLQGRRVAVPLDRALVAGPHEVTWDLRGRDGARVPPGVYYAEFATPAGRSVRRIVVIR